jgi:hypothetical protein
MPTVPAIGKAEVGIMVQAWTEAKAQGTLKNELQHKGLGVEWQSKASSPKQYKSKTNPPHF